MKPEMTADESYGNLSRDARLTFIHLLPLADDEGRLRALPVALIGAIYPYDSDVTPRKLDRWLEEIHAQSMILRYEQAGVPYIAFRNFKKHQRISKASRSELPPPPDAEVVAANAVELAEGGVFTKGAIAEKVRREVAKRAGAIPGETTDAECHWCQRPGTLNWSRMANGKPSAWVRFEGLELDHVIPEVQGGPTAPDNLVLACPECNRRRGHRNGHGEVTESRDPYRDGESREAHG